MAFIAPALSVGGSALGMATGAGGMVQAQTMYAGAMAQTKRYFAANWAESSWRHSEALHQSERHNRDATAFSETFLAQTDKVHLREFRQAELQDMRNYLMTVNAEIREALREIVVAKAYEFNNIMLCDTVCLGCAFALVIEGIPPDGASTFALTAYMCAIALSLAMFFVSLWSAVILARRLNLYTASELAEIFDVDTKRAELGEIRVKALQARAREAGVTEDALKKAGAQKEEGLIKQAIIDLVEEAEDMPSREGRNFMNEGLKTRWSQIDEFEKYVKTEVGTGSMLGKMARFAMLLGIFAIFLGASILVHMRYSLLYQVAAPWICFCSILGVSAAMIGLLEIQESVLRSSKKGVYKRRDTMLKLKRDGKDGDSKEAEFTQELVELHATVQGPLGPHFLAEVEVLQDEKADLCPKLDQLDARLDKLRGSAEELHDNRKKTIRLVTVGDQETDKLIGDDKAVASINAVLNEADEADDVVASMLQEQDVDEEGELDGSFVDEEGEEADWNGGGMRPMSASSPWRTVQDRLQIGGRGTLGSTRSSGVRRRGKALAGPEDALGIMVHTNTTVALKEKLGEFYRSTIIHIENHGNESLNLTSGSLVPLVGSWFEPNGASKGWTHKKTGEIFNFTPTRTIKPHTKVVMVIRGKNFPLPGGAKVELTYETKGGDFKILLTCDNPFLPGKHGTHAKAKKSKGKHGRKPTLVTDLQQQHDETAGSVLTMTSSLSSSNGGSETTSSAMRRHTCMREPTWWDVTVDDRDDSDNNEVVFTLRQKQGPSARVRWLHEQGAGAQLAGDILHSGDLLKAIQRGIFTNWLSRYFVLTGTKLRYYESQDAAASTIGTGTQSAISINAGTQSATHTGFARPLASIMLTNILGVVDRGDGHLEVSAKLKNGSTETHRLCVTQPQQQQAKRKELVAQEWVRQINDARKKAMVEFAARSGGSSAGSTGRGGGSGGGSGSRGSSSAAVGTMASQAVRAMGASAALTRAAGGSGSGGGGGGGGGGSLRLAPPDKSPPPAATTPSPAAAPASGSTGRRVAARNGTGNGTGSGSSVSVRGVHSGSIILPNGESTVIMLPNGESTVGARYDDVIILPNGESTVGARYDDDDGEINITVET